MPKTSQRYKSHSNASLFKHLPLDALANSLTLGQHPTCINQPPRSQTKVRKSRFTLRSVMMQRKQTTRQCGLKAEASCDQVA